MMDRKKIILNGYLSNAEISEDGRIGFIGRISFTVFQKIRDNKIIKNTYNL